MQTKRLIGSVIFCIVMACLFIGIGLFAVSSAAKEKEEFDKNGVPAVATIYYIYRQGGADQQAEILLNDIDLPELKRGKNSGSQSFVVFFTQDNKEIRAKLRYRAIPQYVGKKVNIMYHKDNPNRITIEDPVSFNMTFLYIFGFIGLLLITSAIWGVVSHIKKTIMQKKFRNEDRLVRAQIKGIVEKRNMKFNYVSSRMLEAEYDGKIFHSTQLTNDEIKNINENGTVNVYINRNDANQYFVDLESLK